MKLAFIGCGVMGETILGAVLDKGLAQVENISVVDARVDRCRFIEGAHGVRVACDSAAAVAGSDIVVLAIKPQDLPQAMKALRGALQPHQAVLSIVAGASMATLSEGLGHCSVVRAMPNTPARVGCGMTVWTAAQSVSEEQRERVRSILSAMGTEIYTPDERHIDMATAVSGSGPAYVFLFVEELTKAAEAVGLESDVARELAARTLQGSAAYLMNSNDDPSELRRQVTSPGGTTAAALEELGKGGFGELIARAVRAAYKRAQQLGQ